MRSFAVGFALGVLAGALRVFWRFVRLASAPHPKPLPADVIDDVDWLADFDVAAWMDGEVDLLPYQRMMLRGVNFTSGAWTSPARSLLDRQA